MSIPSFRLSLLTACFLLLPIFLVSPCTSAGEIAPELQATLLSAPAGELLPVIVTFTASPDLQRFRGQGRRQRRAAVVAALQETAAASQKDVRDLLRGRGKKFEPLWIINGLALAASPQLIEDLASRPEVARIEPDGVVELPEVTPGQATAVQWNIEAVRAPDLWGLGINGTGVTVAVLDSGVDLSHPDLGNRWRGGGNSWFDPYTGTTQPYDPLGHGTQVTGIIVGGNASGTWIGVAPGARWIAAKIFDDSGNAVNSQILAAFQWALDPDRNPATDDAADIVNNSWGFEDLPGRCDSFFRTAVQNLKTAGIAVVFSAGNLGPTPSTSVSPANYAESFAVGSANQSLVISDFSSRGPSACDTTIYPELIAPGENILTAVRTDGRFQPFQFVTGTSFSAPHVTGVMALLLSAFDGLTVGDLESALRASARDLGTTGPDNTYGFGLLNALAAFTVLDGEPALAVTDPINPTDDLLLPFGAVAPGGAVDAVLTLRNAGTGILFFQTIGASLQPPFAVIGDGCSGRGLATGESCPITVRFTPGEAGEFTGSLAVGTNAVTGVATVGLTGIGNTPPPPAQLLAPGDNATGLVPPITLEWFQPPDTDGDPLTHSVLLSRSGNFDDSVRISFLSGTATLLASAAGLLLAGLAAGRQCPRVRLLLLAATILLVCWACGGGGSSDRGAPASSGENVRVQADNLDPGTTYFWKVVTRDSRGGEVDSAVRRFTTR